MRRIRERLGITIVEIERASKKIAEAEHNPQYVIRHSHLSLIENSRAFPNIHKLFALCALYHLNFQEVLKWYGLTPKKYNAFQQLISIDKTHLTHVNWESVPSVVVPSSMNPPFDVGETTFLSRIAQAWKEVSPALLARLELRNRAYAYIGLNDYTMYPLLRPGSFVEIDLTKRNILTHDWKSEYDRPVYLIEWSDHYVCSWCSLEQGKLLSIPHPLSHCKPHVFRFPGEATVLGQVVGVAMKLVQPNARTSRRKK